MKAEQFEQTLTPRTRRYYRDVAANARACVTDGISSTWEAIDTAFGLVDPADHGLHAPTFGGASGDQERGYVYSLIRR